MHATLLRYSLLTSYVTKLSWFYNDYIGRKASSLWLAGTLGWHVCHESHIVTQFLFSYLLHCGCILRLLDSGIDYQCLSFRALEVTCLIYALLLLCKLSHRSVLLLYLHLYTVALHYFDRALTLIHIDLMYGNIATAIHMLGCVR